MICIIMTLIFPLQLLMTEFKYDGVVDESFSKIPLPIFDQGKPSWFYFLVKKYVSNGGGAGGSSNKRKPYLWKKNKDDDGCHRSRILFRATHAFVWTSH